MRELFVWKNERLVGRLIAEDAVPQAYTFVYEADVRPGDFISLTMPTTQKVYGPRVMLHPIFDMNLPEADRRAAYSREAARYGGADEFALLLATGSRQIGELRFTDRPEIAASKLKPLQLDKLQKIQNGRQLFEEIFEELAYSSGVSGVQPKVLAPTEESAHPGTIVADTHILKTDREPHRGMVISEYLCQQALSHSGLSVSKCWLSEDGRLLVIERFDRSSDDQPLHFEEVCSLMGLNANDKYSSTYERVAACLAEFLAPANVYTGLRAFFKALVVYRIVGNADGHLKNFAVLCRDFEDVRLAPFYDAISTRAFVDTPPGILLAGSGKWWDLRTLLKFAAGACQLSPKDAREVSEEACLGVEKTLPLLKKYAQTFDSFKEIADNMENVWQSGLRDMRNEDNGPPPKIEYPKRKRPRLKIIGTDSAL